MIQTLVCLYKVYINFYCLYLLIEKIYENKCDYKKYYNERNGNKQNGSNEVHK